MKKIIILAVACGFAAAVTARAADVKDNWNTLCVKCHGADGKGNTKIGARLGVKDFTAGRSQGRCGFQSPPGRFEERR